MKYNPRKNCIQISISEAERAYCNLVYALKNIRLACGLPLDRYERGGALTDADHAQRGILEAAARLGIDMGAEWGNDLDLRDDV